nr:hypothetical protein [Tanacetum cinerariifolium]
MERVSILNFDLYSTLAEKREAWFVASIPFINGLVDEDRNAFVDDSVGVSKDNVVDGQHELGYEDERENETLVENNDQLLLEDGDGVLDSEGGGRNNEVDNVNQMTNVSIAKLFAEVRALRKEVAVIKSTCSCPDMHNAEVACDGMSIDKIDGKNEYTYFQRIPVTLNILIQACAYFNKHRELDVLQHDNYADHSVPKLNQHPTAETLPVPYDYKPPLETIFSRAKSKKKKRGIRKNYVLKFIKERKKRLATALDLPFGQQGTTTPAPQKIRSISSIRDTIVALEFEEEISGQPKIQLINELITIQEFVEPDGCGRDMVTVPDEI